MQRRAFNNLWTGGTSVHQRLGQLIQKYRHAVIDVWITRQHAPREHFRFASRDDLITVAAHEFVQHDALHARSSEFLTLSYFVHVASRRAAPCVRVSRAQQAPHR